jgi:hypothetical protein
MTATAPIVRRRLLRLSATNAVRADTKSAPLPTAGRTPTDATGANAGKARELRSVRRTEGIYFMGRIHQDRGQSPTLRRHHDEEKDCK